MTGRRATNVRAPRARLRHDAGALLWSSFLAACIGAALFFACFDPMLLSDDTNPPHWLADRMSGYALGFFFLWTVCAIAAFLTAWLIGTRADRSAP